MNESSAIDELQQEIFTVEEAAEYLRIGRSLAYGLVRRGELPHLRFGKRVVVPRKALDRYIEARTERGKASAAA